MIRECRVPLRVLAPLFMAIVGLAALSAPAVAQAGGSPGPGTSVGMWSFTSAAAMARAAGPVAAQVVVAPPRPGVMPGAAAITGEADLFYTGTDGHAYVAGLAPAFPPEPLGGHLVGGPAPVAIPSGSLGGPAIALFARGTDNALWIFNGGNPPQWVTLGGHLTSKPAAAAGDLTGGETIDVVARGSDGAVWDRQLAATALRPWTRVGGHVLAGTGPAAVNVGGTLYVLAVGTDGALWRNSSTDGTTWSGWHSLGGHVTGPSAATPAAGVGVAFARGTNNAAYYNEFAGTTPGVSPGWHTLGGKITSGVGAASAPDGTTWALALSLTSRIWQRTGVWPTLSGWSRAL